MRWSTERTGYIVMGLLLFLLAGLAEANRNVVCVGDSIVASYPATEYHQGWGESIKYKLTDTHVHNLAAPGRSSKSFINEGLWADALDVIDSTGASYVFIEFGHNDNLGKGEARETDPNVNGDFREYIRQYIDDSRAYGAVPILVTPPPRRLFYGGVIDDTANYPYAEAMLAVAAEKACAVVDLHTKVLALFNSLGKKDSDYLVGTMSNWHKDNTHFSHTGSLVLADMIVEDLLTREPGLAPYIDLDGGPGPIGPAGWPDPSPWTIHVPPSAALTWTGGANALGHAIHFGTTNPPPFVANLTAPTPLTYLPEALEEGQTYYWQITAINQRGTAPGPVWSFGVNAWTGDLEIEEEILLPEDDARLYAGNADKNYGRWASFLARHLGSETMNTGILQFRLPPDDRILYQARLELWNRSDQAAADVRVFALRDGAPGEDIDENLITFNNAPGVDIARYTLNGDTQELFSMPGGPAQTLCLPTSWAAWEATNDLLAQDTNGILTFYAAGSDLMEFYSTEGGAAGAMEPCLRLWYIKSDCPVAYPGDLNTDCRVNLLDLSILASQWLTAPSVPSADIAPAGSPDGIVNAQDLTLLAADWLAP